MIRIALFAAALLATPAAAHAEGKAVIRFETGAPTGAVMVALFDSRDAYEGRGAPVATMRVPADAATVEAVFPHLPDGDYAAKAFHDLNDDHEMNANPFGMPTEPFAFSNNARGHMGPAGWDAARFAVAGETAQTISLK